MRSLTPREDKGNTQTTNRQHKQSQNNIPTNTPRVPKNTKPGANLEERMLVWEGI